MGPYDPGLGVQGLSVAPGHIGNHMTRSPGFGCCVPVVPNLADLAKFVPEFSGGLPRKWDLGPTLLLGSSLSRLNKMFSNSPFSNLWNCHLLQVRP
jgi:hypothetical protein